MVDKVGMLASALAGINPVTLVTGVKYTASLVKTFNNMTFLYDPNWEYVQGEPSYPIAFFFVKSMTEQMSSDISQKPMLFYNTASDGTDATQGGLLNIIADNIIIKPKTYRLEVIIPANGTALSNTFFNAENVSVVNNFTFKESAGGNLGNTIGLISDMCLNILSVLFTSLYGNDLSLSTISNAILQQQDYNKASIENMWRSRRILKMKLWNGWKFKYLAIKDCDISKVGEDGDFYKGTITCQEMPVLTFRNQKKSALSALSSISSALGQLQKKAVDTFISAMETTLGENGK
jgi:hypothetical protein